ncbi:MAG: hypothetical protein AAFP88_00905 [Bacteroidota bacterium]
MKKISIVLTALLITAIGSPAFAKKKAKRKKAKSRQTNEWQQRKDDMKPLQLKDLVEENHRLKMGNKKLTEEVRLTQQELEKLLRLKAKIDALRKKRGQDTSNDDENYDNLDKLFVGKKQKQQKVVSIDGLRQDDWAVGEDGKPFIKGIIFKVQIGAYKKRDLSNVLEEDRPQEVFEQEQTEDINQYTLRHFRDYWKADKFKKELRAMGLKDAWIVAFKDGKRVRLKAVLKAIRKKN